MRGMCRLLLAELFKYVLIFMMVMVYPRSSEAWLPPIGTWTRVTCPGSFPACNGGTVDQAGSSCQQLLDNGVTVSGNYYIKPSSTTIQVYCDMSTNGVAGLCGTPQVSTTIFL